MNGDTGLSPGDGPAAAWRTIMLIVMAVLGAGVLVAIVLTMGAASRQRDRALAAQAHSYDVMILARTLAGQIARSEASLGRYVISGDRQLGQLYFDEWRLAGQQIDRLDQITDDNGAQQPRLDRLRAAYRARGSELSLTALSTNYGKNSQALSRYYEARKAPSLETINRQLDAIIADERGLLDRRSAAATASVDRSTRTAFYLSIFGGALVLGAILLGWLTVKAMGERAMARAEAEEERGRAAALALAVAEATDELRDKEARLRQVQKMEAVGQLTGGIAHDFNNMLAVVLGGLELARLHLPARTKARRHIDSATEGAERAAALTRRLLAFAREETLNPEPISPAALIAGMRDLLDRTLGDGVTVAIETGAADGSVRADRVQLENALLNLAVNARDAMDGRGTLTIAARIVRLDEGQRGGCAAGDYVAIDVTDTGTGMTPEVAERVFEPFFTTKPVGKGTGLGLSQIFGFARQAGGDVAIDTAPGRGTTVTLYLPRDAAVPVALVDDAEAMVSAVVEGAAPLRVLVVEDDPRVLAATLGALDELGHVAVACDDPLAAPALLARDDAFDLIVTDVLMPGRTGPEMIASLGPAFAHIAVLFVTGFAGEAAEFGGRQVLRKPFTLAGLERAIREAMLAERPEPPAQIAAE